LDKCSAIISCFGVGSVINVNLFFTTDIASSIKKADIIFVSVNTPTKFFGKGAGLATDMQYWEKVARDILVNAEHDTIIVEKSTLPVRTAESMSQILNGSNKNIHFEILSNPEFLAEGTAIEDLKYPDRILIGGNLETKTGRDAVKKIVDIYKHWVPKEKILTTDVWSSELSKLVANAFLAQRISSINSISALAEVTGANIKNISKAIGMDSRIGSKFLQAGVGFGGSCFKKDILNLVYLCKYYNLPEVANYWMNVVDINEWQKTRFVKRIISAMFNTLADKQITIFGFSFKADTGDTRETPALSICRQLVDEHANVIISDPESLDNAKKDLEDIKSRICFEKDPYKASCNSHAIIFLTDWKEYKYLDFSKIVSCMKKPAFLFDGRNFLDHDYLHSIGFNVYRVGSEDKIHFSNGI
jgi:UDPglucose 6-dehydrogenase